MSFTGKVLLVCLLANALSLFGFAQEAMQYAPTAASTTSKEAVTLPQPGASESTPNPTFKVSVNSVFLTLSVRDLYSNRSLSHLGKEDFQVYEDGELQDVEQFQPAEVPFHLLMLLDVSGSTAPYVDLMKRASIDFTKQLRSDDRVAVAMFNNKSELIQNFTADRDRVGNAIDWLRSGGGTAFYDALDASIRQYMQHVRGRKAIVVFTDGADNRISGGMADGSRISFEHLLRRVQDSDTIVYPILLDSGAGSALQHKASSLVNVLGQALKGQWPSYLRQIAREQLQTIAEQTGGRLYAPRRIENLHDAYSEIADDLRVQYHLGYNSSNPSKDGRWRDITVTLKNRPEATVRTRKGYYAGEKAPKLMMNEW